jgi:hypothetical protein
MEGDLPAVYEPHRQAAAAAIAEAAKSPFPLKQFASAVQQFQMTLRRHGLGLALAWLELRSGGKPGSPYMLLTRQMDRWLLTTLAVSARSALAAISARDSLFYREASAQAWRFVSAVREHLEVAP